MELVTGKPSLQNALDESSAFLSARFRYQAHAVMSPPVIILLSVGFVIALMPVYARQNPAPLRSAAENAGAFDPAAATEAWLATVPRDKREKSDAYFEGGYWLLLWNFLFAAGTSIFLLASGISARLRDFAEDLAGSRNFGVACYVILYFLIVAALSFPLNVYEHFFREHQYGFATQSFLAWFCEQLIGFGLTLLAGTLLLI